MMGRVYARRRAPTPWAMPSGVREVAVDSLTRMAAGEPCDPAPARRELFLASAVPTGACVRHPDGTWGPARAPVPLPGDSLPGPDTLPALPQPDTLGAGPPQEQDP
jgi:hypothetical protein